MKEDILIREKIRASTEREKAKHLKKLKYVMMLSKREYLTETSPTYQ